MPSLRRMSARATGIIGALTVLAALVACSVSASQASSPGGGSPTSGGTTPSVGAPTSTATATEPPFTPGPAHVVFTIIPSSYCTQHPNTCGNPPLATKCSTGSYPSFKLHNIGGKSVNFGVTTSGSGNGGLPGGNPGFGSLDPGQSIVVALQASSGTPGWTGPFVFVSITWGSQPFGLGGQASNYNINCL